jgi:alkylated DNA repair dioxygenase AlkB
LELVNKKFKTRFNGILVNKYANGLDNIGEHSDDESQLDNAGVVAISYGAIRKFRIRDKKTKKIVKDIPTLPNQIIQMAGDFQKEFKHGIPVEKKVKEPRISFTFRKHIK